MAKTEPVAAGDRLGGWEILRALDAGGMGQVLVARKRGPGGFERLAAVKTIRAELRASDPVRRMFLDEAQLVARLSHPAIAQIYDCGDEDGTLYLAMEYVSGVSLGALDLRPPPAVCARIVAAACRGLHAAHELTDLRGQSLGVVHRDVSPDNLMVTFDGQVKVLDFGIALMRGRSAPVTEMGLAKGKPPYLSPQQVTNQPIDRRTDVWSAAVVLHELLTGRPLFDGDSLYAIARAIAEQPIEPPSAIAGPLPSGLDAVVLCGLCRDPEGRFQTAAAFADALDSVADVEGGEDVAAFAARALAPAREEHRRFLRALVDGVSAGRTVARPSGMVTALAVATTEPAVAEPEAAAEAAAVPETVAAPRRRRLLLLASLLLIGAGVGAWRVLAPDVPAPIAIAPPPDAAPVTIAVAPPDAAAPVVETAPVDAGAPVVVERPARRPRRTVPASPVSSTAPAPEAAAPAATVTIAARPFATIKVDGAVLTTTPVFRHPIAAGRHEIVLVDPASGQERLRKTIVLAPGEHRDIVIGQ